MGLESVNSKYSRFCFLDYPTFTRLYYYRSVKSWESPKTPSEVWSFLGLTGYYRKFIKDFSRIAIPLTALTKKNVEFEWAKEQEEAFTMLKGKLCSAPILALPDGNKGMVVFSDASHLGLGCVLMQHGKVIAYASR
ncbi:hypothetical protein OSB04_006863 [Centaurea solstitialis]|uniref:Reverse transcriptase/retrotransposon-derived protein RNase H-like domain-containing protein n=1 Tax=Centaurea solstitialis TaxID=347529 RepID=A0AA38TIQ9_9ASTR|nr:hypothetical protein OSB04_006863 [Centaurea solstitialis]